jgi:hypothetical protein
VDRPHTSAHSTFDLSSSEMDELAQLLRSLPCCHVQPYIEQSVRGGAQTERPLFFRIEPIIAAAEAKITEAVRAYIARSAVEGAVLARPRRVIECCIPGVGRYG